MPERNAVRQPFDEPIACHILLMGRLDRQWSDFLCGMRIDSQEDERGVVITSLTGMLPDQASLLGVLNIVYELGLTLLQVQSRILRG